MKNIEGIKNIKLERPNNEKIIQNTDGLIQSDYHSLFIKNIPEELVPLTDENGLQTSEYYQKIPQYKLYSLFLGSFEDSTSHGFNRILDALQSSNAEDVLDIHIASNGGYTTEGMILFNIINTLYRGKTSTYLHYGYSMGALAFLYGNERVIYENSSLMIHNWSGGFIGKAYDIESRLKHTKKHLWSFFSKIIKPYLNTEELSRVKRGEDIWFNSREMLSKGIATDIIINDELLTAKEYFKKYNKNGDIKKKWIKNNKSKEIKNTEDAEKI